MTTEKILVEVTKYRSDVFPKVETTDPEVASMIGWADANPQVWEIVMGTRSKALGRNSSEYLGWVQKSNEPIIVLERVKHFYTRLHGLDTLRQSIFVWRAQFTFDHYDEKGFKGGFFQQYDEKFPHPHNCLTLDYTPATLEEVIDRFERWMDKCYRTVRIEVNGVTMRTYPEVEAEGDTKISIRKDG